MSLREFIVIISVVGIFVLFNGVTTRQYQALRGEKAELLPAPVAAQRIQEYADANLPSCFSNLQGDFAALTKAVIAVEFISVSPIEVVVENTIMRTMAMLGLFTPDYSIGLAQIRPSTVEKLLKQESIKSSAELFRDTTTKLLNDCENINLSKKIIAALARKHNIDQLNVNTALPIIAEYNSQLTDRLENQVYTKLVQILYKNYLKI